MKKTYTILVSMGGQISSKIVMDARDTAGQSIVRMIADDAAGYAQCKADTHNCTYDVSIDDGEHELLLMGKPESGITEVRVDGEVRSELADYAGYDRFRMISEFIGYDM